MKSWATTKPAMWMIRSALLNSEEFFAFVCGVRRDIRQDAICPFEVHVREHGHVVAIVCFERRLPAIKFWEDLVSGICAEAAAGSMNLTG